MARYLRPRTLEAALEALAADASAAHADPLDRLTPLSGGTDFYPAAATRQAWFQPTPRNVLDISGVDEMRGIAAEGAGIRIGALTTWTALMEHPLPPAFDALKQAARQVGGVQIQNRGTLAGNLCNASPAADGGPPLLALDAEVELASAPSSLPLAGRVGRAVDGEGVAPTFPENPARPPPDPALRAGPLSPQGGGLTHRILPLSEFLLGNRRTALGPSELVTAILVPQPDRDERSIFLKLGARAYLVISIASVAANIALDAQGRIARARIAVGACSAVPQRLGALEERLVGEAPEAASRAVEPVMLAALSPIDDVRASAAYRLEAALMLVRRALDALAEPRSIAA